MGEENDERTPRYRLLRGQRDLGGGRYARDDDQAVVYPRVTPSGDLHDTLEVRSRENLATLDIDGVSVVSYSATPREHIGKRVELAESDLEGVLFFNTDFFRAFDLKKPMESVSDMENIAKTFFRVGNRRYVALAQLLKDGGRSAEHYHTLPESIVQIAGMSYVELRPVDNDTDFRVIELTPGEILRIPPQTLHVVGTIEGDSLTVPIKETLRRRKDHLYAPRSEGRMKQDLSRLLSDDYNSGGETVCALQRYRVRLGSEGEKASFEGLAERRLESEGNPNIKRVLRRFFEDSF